MKPSRFVNLLVVFLFVVVSFAIPGTVSATQSSQQTTGDITGVGQICNSRGQCGEFSITFNPIGGPVTGSVYVNWPITNLDTGEKIGEEILQGTLTGTFDGEDGGAVRGTMATGQVTITWSITCDTCINETLSTVGTTWEGNLRADGTGNGRIGPVDILWNVTYSAADFQAGLGGSSRATKTPTTGTQAAGTPQPTLPGKTIHATGQVCWDQTNCGNFQLTFNTAGGPVTGSYGPVNCVYVSNNPYGPGQLISTYTLSGTLTGAFSGGDGGLLTGTATWVETNGTFTFEGKTEPQSDITTTAEWNGRLYANGTGTGWLSIGAWTVGFSAADFQAGLAAATQATLPPTETSQEYIQHQIAGISIEMGDKAWSEHELQLIKEVLGELPPGLLGKLSLQSIVRYTSKWDKNGKLNDGVMGDYSPVDQRECPTCARSPQTIRIFDSATQMYEFSDATGDTTFKATILHEITHALQYYKNDQDIYANPNSENPLVQGYVDVSGTGLDGWAYYNGKWNYQPVTGNNPPTNYGMTNPMEDMSESVKMYVYNPQLLQTSSPQRYTYIRDKVFGGIEYDNGKQKAK